MAATDTTQESVIILPSGQESQVATRESGTTAVRTISGTITNAKAEIIEGTSKFNGGEIRRGSFTFTEPSSPALLNFSSDVVRGRIKGSTGQDSIRFSSSVKSTTIRAEAGADSITFAKGSTSINNRISLGKDSDADVVSFASLDDVKGTRITNFGREDKLRIGGESFNYDDLQNQNFGSKLTIKFD
jgi:hypothetical protein